MELPFNIPQLPSTFDGVPCLSSARRHGQILVPDMAGIFTNLTGMGSWNVVATKWHSWRPKHCPEMQWLLLFGDNVIPCFLQVTILVGTIEIDVLNETPWCMLMQPCLDQVHQLPNFMIMQVKTHAAHHLKHHVHTYRDIIGEPQNDCTKPSSTPKFMHGRYHQSKMVHVKRHIWFASLAPWHGVVLHSIPTTKLRTSRLAFSIYCRASRIDVYRKSLWCSD